MEHQSRLVKYNMIKISLTPLRVWNNSWPFVPNIPETFEAPGAANPFVFHVFLFSMCSFRNSSFLAAHSVVVGYTTDSCYTIVPLLWQLPTKQLNSIYNTRTVSTQLILTHPFTTMFSNLDFVLDSGCR